MSGKQFVISAHVVRQLGEQLVSDEVTAIIELVKNAYDADARRIAIVVDTRAPYTDNVLAWVAAKRPARVGYVSIHDTGTGMDDADVTKGWLHISFSAKRGLNKLGVTTPRYGRSVLGSKGVGRLSAQRLGNSLDLFSLKEYHTKETNHWTLADKGVHLGIDWNDFKENVPLQQVPVFEEEWMPKDGKAGTTLVVTDLKNPSVWEDDDSRKSLVSTLTQLISPFAPAKSFSISLKINTHLVDLHELSKKARNAAIGTFKFKFDNQELIITGRVKTSLFRGNNASESAEHYQLIAQDNGRDFFEYLKRSDAIPNIESGTDGWFFEFTIRLQAESLGLAKRPVKLVGDNNGTDLPIESLADEAEALAVEIVSPGFFEGEIDQLAYENAETDLKGSVFTNLDDYKQYVRRQAGVRIYRDGFGIRPYGIDGDDWMGFQAGTTSGRSFYGLRPKNLIGYISLTAKDNDVLEEKTDREGFVLNDASRNFFTLVYQVRDEINGVLTRSRRRFNQYKELQYSKVAQVSSPTEVINQLRATTQQVSLLRDRARQTKIDSVKESITRKIQEVKASPLLSSGNDAGLEKLLLEAREELTHSQEIHKTIYELQAKLDQLLPTASYLESQLQQLSDQVSDFAELAGLGMTAEALTHEIGNIVDRLLDEAKQASDILRRQKAADPQLLLFAERVRSSLHALRRQTQHLDDSLHYVREKRELVQLPAFVEELKKFYESRSRFQESGITIATENVDANPFSLFCNKGKLTQVFDNLIINSEYWLRESVKQGKTFAPQILIRLANPFVEISDNGIGVDPGIVSQLFQPFTTTKPRSSGRGLGLFISKQLLESVGSSISLLPTMNRFNRPYTFQLDFTGSLYDKSSTSSK